MKKIAVISSFAYIEHYLNYGSLLQYYALQIYLQKKGFAPYWIRYCMPGEKLKDKIKWMIRHPITYWNVFMSKKNFQNFIKKHLTCSEKKYSDYNSIEMNPPEADYYVTGSDQVWGGTLKANYLCWAPNGKKRIAYAASFGRQNLEKKQREIIAPWVRNIDYISVREAEGVRICEELGCKAEWLLDPTLLLDGNEYLMSTKKYTDSVFCYFLNIEDTSDIYLEEIKKYADQLQLRLCISAVQGSEKKFHKDDLVFPTPYEWIKRYSDAKCIFTNTFHGTVFALIYRKPFLVFLQKGEKSQQNNRLISLLECFGLTQRIYDQFNGSIEHQMNEEIDWGSFEEKLLAERKKVEGFWDKILNCKE